jgi:predicted Zn-dependent peptidase
LVLSIYASLLLQERDDCRYCMKNTHPRLLNDALSNGLRIVGEVRPEGESVAICFAVLAGSRDERRDVPLGTAHALEHMLFKGTRKRSSQHVLEAFTRIGAEINAATFSAATVYQSRYSASTWSLLWLCLLK